MTAITIVRRCAYYTGICAFLMLAMGTSHAKKFIPVAVDDPTNEAVSGDSETLHIDVLDNDERLNDGVAELLVATPTGFVGTAVKAGADGDVNRLHIHYTYPAGFGGTEMFTYEIVDNDGDISNSATVTVTVDGSIAQTKAGSNKVVFGGAAYPDSGVPLSAVGENANEPGGTSTVQCCTVLDPRVAAGPAAFQAIPFDLGAALSSTDGCDDMPMPGLGALIVPRHFGVHTEDLLSTEPEDYKFGVCAVETDVVWDGPMQVDIVAEPVVGYKVDCKTDLGVDKQPLTLGLSADPAEFTSPEMRAITSECDPRGVTRWSLWYFVVNAVHLTDQEDSRTYVGRMAFVLKTMMEKMRQEGVANSAFLNDVKTLVLNAQAAIGSKKWTQAEALSAMATLDVATLLALTPPDDVTYSPTPSFSNPKGELVSHLAALRYAVCSEFAHPGELGLCTMHPSVDLALPKLP